jgi:hypothetical protein
MTSYDDNNQLPRIEAVLRAQRADAFAPGFSDRVMARLARAPRLTLGTSMQRYFAWMTPALVAAILLLAVLNMRAAGQTGVGAALGLPQVSVAVAYALDAGTTDSEQ